MSIITYESWIAALDAMVGPQPDALTARGWATKLGINRYNSARWIDTGLTQGWMERAITTVDTITGIPKNVVGFRLKKRGKK